MKLISVASSSSGNSTLVFNNDTFILIDAGAPVKTVLARTKRKSFNGLFISHIHADHVKSAGALYRKTKVPIYVNPLVKAAKPNVFKGCLTYDINDVDEVLIGSMKVKPFSTKHDSIQTLGFVISDKDTVFGYVTDTGSFSKTMLEALKSCNAIMIESDYDEDMIKEYEGYSTDLKDRIQSSFGHLSNQQTLGFIRSFDISKLSAVIIGHLSENTNSPEQLNKRIKEYFPNTADQAKFHVAPLDGEIDL